MTRKLFVLALTALLALVGAGTASAQWWPPSWWPAPVSGTASWQERLTGADMYTCSNWAVCGTDLGIPYDNPRFGSVSYLFGDTFNSPWPEQPNNDWRSPVGLRSTSHPRDGIRFDSAYGVGGNQRAPEIMYNGHHRDGEVTVIPNDGVVLPDGRHIVSYMSVRDWHNNGTRQWLTNYSGLAVSGDGNFFSRTGPRWGNNGAGNDPFQMVSMQLAGDFVYMVSVPAGRQPGPMMLQRVRWDRILDRSAYEGWGFSGGQWRWGVAPTPILQGHFGEPSLRLLDDGTWALAYLNVATGNLVTRTASAVDGAWTAEKVQLTQQQEPNLYGGFIHPRSTRGEAYFMVSRWSRNQQGQSTAYHVSSYRGTL